jgi:hypothetical protein
MLCVTIKTGVDCTFMSKKGCTYTGGACNPIIEKCEGCENVMDLPTGKYCKVYADPGAKWAFGTCNYCTHVELHAAVEQKHVNPLKASKRASRGR